MEVGKSGVSKARTPDLYPPQPFKHSQHTPHTNCALGTFTSKVSRNSSSSSRNEYEILQARENLMETIQAFLKEYDHIPPKEKCMGLLLAKERFLKIKQAVEEEQNQPEVMQDLLLKLMNDLQILKGIQPKQEEPAAQSFLLNWNFPMADDDEYTIIYRKPKAITP
ncbi:hypothetical protein Tco_0418892 [Tanacetum coccineum]